MKPTYKPGQLLECNSIIVDVGKHHIKVLSNGVIGTVRKKFGPKSMRAHYVCTDPSTLKHDHVIECNGERTTLSAWRDEGDKRLFSSRLSPMKFYQHALTVLYQPSLSNNKPGKYSAANIRGLGSMIMGIPLDILDSLACIYSDKPGHFYHNYDSMSQSIEKARGLLKQIPDPTYVVPTFEEIVEDIRDDLGIEDIDTYFENVF